MTSSDKLAPEISRVLERLGVELDDLTISKAGSRRVLDIVVDADAAIDLDRLADISRAISDLLDDSDLMGTAPYVMEIGTRGIGKPLTKAAHWRRNVGRLVKIKLATAEVTGRIAEFEDPKVTLNVEGQLRTFDVSSISRAVIEVDFSRKEGDA